MSGKNYKHTPPPSKSAEAFIIWCSLNIAEWPDEYISCTRHIGTKNKWWKRNVMWRMNHHGLSPYNWAVCTKSQWKEAKGEIKINKDSSNESNQSDAEIYSDQYTESNQ